MNKVCSISSLVRGSTTLIRLMTLAVLVLALAACGQKPAAAGADLGARQARAVDVVERGFRPLAGDQVWIRVFDERGRELVFETVDVSKANLNSWREDLGHVLDEGKASRYLRADLDLESATSERSGLGEAKQVWLKNPEHYFVVGLSH